VEAVEAVEEEEHEEEEQEKQENKVEEVAADRQVARGFVQALIRQAAVRTKGPSAEDVEKDKGRWVERERQMRRPNQNYKDEEGACVGTGQYEAVVLEVARVFTKEVVAAVLPKLGPGVEVTAESVETDVRCGSPRQKQAASSSEVGSRVSVPDVSGSPKETKEAESSRHVALGIAKGGGGSRMQEEVAAPFESRWQEQEAQTMPENEAKVGGASSSSSPQVAHCEQGHVLVPREPTDDGWACDGRIDPRGCVCGIDGYFQTFGMQRFECRICDYDLCEGCHARLLGLKPPPITKRPAPPKTIGEAQNQQGSASSSGTSPAISSGKVRTSSPKRNASISSKSGAKSQWGWSTRSRSFGGEVASRFSRVGRRLSLLVMQRAPS